jgi:rubrerythrin
VEIRSRARARWKSKELIVEFGRLVSYGAVKIFAAQAFLPGTGENDMQTSEMQSTKHIANKLNDALRGELAAVETYKQALELVQTRGPLYDVLEDCENCHAYRVRFLVQQLLALGEEPAKSSGIWGAFAKFMEGTAKVVGIEAAISMLEEGEGKGVIDYMNLLQDSNPAVKKIAGALLERQTVTHKKMSALKHVAPRKTRETQRL